MGAVRTVAGVHNCDRFIVQEVLQRLDIFLQKTVLSYLGGLCNLGVFVYIVDVELGLVHGGELE